MAAAFSISFANERTNGDGDGDGERCSRCRWVKLVRRGKKAPMTEWGARQTEATISRGELMESWRRARARADGGRTNAAAPPILPIRGGPTALGADSIGV